MILVHSITETGNSLKTLTQKCDCNNVQLIQSSEYKDTTVAIGITVPHFESEFSNCNYLFLHVDTISAWKIKGKLGHVFG